MNSKGCIFLEEGINFDLDTVTDCCILHGDNQGLPILLKNYHGETIDWEKLFELKSQRVSRQKQATIHECEGCYKLSDYEFKHEKKISEFHFSHCRICNSNCIYCSSTYNALGKNYNVYPVIKDLVEKGYYKSGGEATMQGGEPTLMDNFEELVDLFTINGTRIRVHTSAIKYSEKVANALRNNSGLVVVSIDSASAQTYKKVKRVNCFDIVVENIKKYVQASSNSVIVKYIIIPGVNDNIEEVNAFFKLMKEIGVKKVAIDIELKYAEKYQHKDVSTHIYMLFDYFEFLANKFNMELNIYSFLGYVLNNRKIKKAKFLANKFLFGLFLNLHNNKKKNLIYK